MGFTRTEAIVLKAKHMREADTLITLFTKEQGKVQVLAKGLRKMKSRYGAKLEMFTHNEVMLFQKTERDLLKVTGCKMIHSFYSLRESFFKYSLGSYFLELTDRLTEYKQVNEELFVLLGRSLGLMDARVLKTRENYLQLWNWFALQILDLSGYRLSLQSCVFCRGMNSAGEEIRIDVSNGGRVCSHCLSRSESTLILQERVWYGLKELQKTPVQNLMGVPLSFPERVAMKEFLEHYLTYILGYPLHSQEFFLQDARCRIQDARFLTQKA